MKYPWYYHLYHFTSGLLFFYILYVTGWVGLLIILGTLALALGILG